MSIDRREDSPFWLSSFSLSDTERSRITQQLEAGTLTYSAEVLVQYMCQNQGYRYHMLDRKQLEKSCEIVALKTVLCNTSLPYDFLIEEERAKANAVFARGQYNSKILQKLLCVFGAVLQSKRNTVPQGYFTLAIQETYQTLVAEELMRTYGPLIKVVDQIASGVKSSVYVTAERFPYYGESTLNDKLNERFLQNTSYDFNRVIEKLNDRPYFPYDPNNQDNKRLLQKALLNDDGFWASHKSFDVVTFLNETAEQNDCRHAEKLLDHITKNLSKIPNMALVFQHGLPLYASDFGKMLEALEDQTRRFAFSRLSSYCDTTKLNDMPLCYPMSKIDPEHLVIGKRVWEGFIHEHNYPEHGDEVMAYLEQEVMNFAKGTWKKDSSNIYNMHGVAPILDSASFRFYTDASERVLFNLYEPNCFSFESIWNRVYLKAYAVTKLSNDTNTQYSYLQRIFVDIIKMIELNLGICTKHQLDTAKRTEQFEKLKTKLSSYNLTINDTHKEEYVTALLDRDTAMINEVELFPVLEQLGDAIYGLAVAELLFYNPETENMAKSFEDHTRAEAQVYIAKKQGFDSLFLQIGLPAKYVEYDTLSFDYDTEQDERLQTLNQEKYLADMMEMLIGAICRDQGLNAALDFSKQLLKKAFGKALSIEIRPTEEYKHDHSIDRDYWTRILPAPCSVMDRPLNTMWHALDKVLLVISLGTEDQDTRIFITHSYGNTAIYGEKHLFGSVSWTFYDYLTKGLDFVLNKVKEPIITYYKTQNDNQ